MRHETRDNDTQRHATNGLVSMIYHSVCALQIGSSTDVITVMTSHKTASDITEKTVAAVQTNDLKAWLALVHAVSSSYDVISAEMI